MSDLEINTFSKDRFVCIGKIVGRHGFKGILKLHAYTESMSFFQPDAQIWARNLSGGFCRFTIEWIKPHKKGFLIFFKDVLSEGQTQHLINAELFIQRDQMPEPDEGSYYWADLIGLSVYTLENMYLGKLEYIFSTGSNDVFVVKDHGTEKLVPALESVVKKINLSERTMHIQLPEGL